MFFLACICFFLPSFIQRPLRNFFGGKIDSTATLSIFSFVCSEKIRMGKYSKISPLSFVRLKELTLDNYSVIDSLVLVNCTKKSLSRLCMGMHSRIFSFCHLEPSEGIILGNNVGVASHCLLICHGSWQNYLKGGGYTKGPIIIHDNVGVTMRVMIFGGTEIGAGTVIGAHSYVRGKLKENCLYAGVPAKLIKENFLPATDTDERKKRFKEIVDDFSCPDTHFINIEQFDASVIDKLKRDSIIVYCLVKMAAKNISIINNLNISYFDLEQDFCYLRSKKAKLFVQHLSEYGIRLEIK